jgi:hypothetical protein
VIRRKAATDRTGRLRGTSRTGRNAHNFLPSRPAKWNPETRQSAFRSIGQCERARNGLGWWKAGRSVLLTNCLSTLVQGARRPRRQRQRPRVHDSAYLAWLWAALQRIPFSFEIFNFLPILSIFALKHETYQPLSTVMAKRDPTKVW